MYEDPKNNETAEERSGADSWYAAEAPSAAAQAAREPVSPEIKKKSGLSAGKVIALLLACLLLGGAAGFGGYRIARRSAAVPAGTERVLPEEGEAAPEVNSEPQPELPAAEKPETAAPAKEEPAENAAKTEEKPDTRPAGAEIKDAASRRGEEEMSAADVYEANVNSTVGITTSVVMTNYWGYQSTAPASGSGFILTEDGYIVTNYHVVKDASSITVATYDNRSFPATVVGYDASSDVAVLKVDATGLTPVAVGDSGKLRVGDDVIAIGNPLGELTFSLTHGVVSAMDREVTLSSDTTMKLIQTDAAINSGNSGGALFNMYGEVVGITNAKYSSSSGSGSASIDNIGFAIPINQVKSIISSIIEYGYIVKPYIGVSVTTVSAELQSYGLPQGAAVKSVTEGSPAQEAGLLVNDIITAVNGREITSSSDLVTVISESQPGDRLTLTVYRQGEDKTLELSITIGQQKQEALPSPQPTQEPRQDPYDGYDGFGGYPFPFFGWG